MHDLGLEPFRTKGRARTELAVEMLRELDPADLEILANVEKGSTTAPLKRISERHHSLARMIVSGMSMGEAALITGYDLSRISILKNDPTFQELLQFYTNDKNRAFTSSLDKAAAITSLGLDILATRMETQEDDMSSALVLKIVETLADRSGLGPSSTSTVNVNDQTASRLEAARARLNQRRASPLTIEGEPNDK